MSTYKDSLLGAIRKLCTQLNGKFAKKSDVPTKVSQLSNDSGYLTQHQSLDGYVKTSGQNVWGAQQTFNLATLGYEQHTIMQQERLLLTLRRYQHCWAVISQQCLRHTSLLVVIMRCPSPTAERLNTSVLLPT